MLTCYSRRRQKTITIPEGHGYCLDCDRILPSPHFTRSKSHPTGLYYYCRICHNAQKECHATEQRKRNTAAKYGLTLELYGAMLHDSGGLCTICGQPESAIDHRTNRVRALAVDHCHTTQVIRGLLCRRCNLGIGLLRHDPTILGNAIHYLSQAHGEPIRPKAKRGNLT